MLATSQSPRSYSNTSITSDSSYPSRAHYDSSGKQPQTILPTSQTEVSRKPLSPFIPHPIRRFSARSLDSFSPPVRPRRNMVDAGTQYSPPTQPASPKGRSKTPTSTIAGLQLVENTRESEEVSDKSRDKKTQALQTATHNLEDTTISDASVSTLQTKRQAEDRADEDAEHGSGANSRKSPDDSPSKRLRPDAPPVHVMPLQYETCETRDLVILISSMLMELIRFNDAIPLRDGHLTRFHSRAPPGISVLDYLQRLTTHATLSPPILLSMVYYIDKLCALYPAFTISSLTVHRFLITSATVASKGLSDSFWTNKTYARVGGVSIKELALLELEFLTRVDWKIVPKPEVLVDYYKSLVKRNSEYQLEEQ